MPAHPKPPPPAPSPAHALSGHRSGARGSVSGRAPRSGSCSALSEPVRFAPSRHAASRRSQHGPTGEGAAAPIKARGDRAGCPCDSGVSHLHSVGSVAPSWGDVRLPAFGHLPVLPAKSRSREPDRGASFWPRCSPGLAPPSPSPALCPRSQQTTSSLLLVFKTRGLGWSHLPASWVCGQWSQV